ncbi:hypothetical protein [Streptococcus equinus]|uniref:hypothetical protein n=1 Tax=Streptococcus equinus TaxID=1335 RepID=UPI0008B3843D|nr:hypothetical protein [Streptococcus equinus]SEK77281.1 hypothetical protein SAMN05216373_0919 [Streptococcus equinus]
MKSFKKYLIGIGVLLTLVFLGSYAYNQVGYKLAISDVEKIAYQNAGVTKSKVVSQTLMKSREGMFATYKIRFETTSKRFVYTINASTGSIIDRRYKVK